MYHHALALISALGLIILILHALCSKDALGM